MTRNLITELNRRNVFKVSIAYLALGWLVIQVTATAVPALNLPESLNSIVFYLGLIGFPFALFFAWAFKLTPERVKRTSGVNTEDSTTHLTGRKLDFFIIGVLVLLVAGLVYDGYLSPQNEIVTSGVEPVKSEAIAKEASPLSIAVLAFEDFSPGQDQEYFADGISEEILNVLAKIPDLQVTSRSSSFSFKDKDKDIPAIAAQLGVDNVLEGSIRKSGTRVRITAQLIDAKTDKHLWTQNYDRELTDIFAVQDEIAAAIVEALKIKLGIEMIAPKVVAGTLNSEAHDAYLMGRHFFETRTEPNLKSARDYFEQAVVLDPKYTQAWAELGNTLLLLSYRNYGSIPVTQSWEQAQRAIMRAVALNPDIAEVQTALGHYYLNTGDREAAVPLLERALELNPNSMRAYHWLALSYSGPQNFKLRFQAMKTAARLDPLSLVIQANLTIYYGQLGEFEEADRILMRMQAIDPNALMTLSRAGYNALQRGNYAEAVIAFRAWQRAGGSNMYGKIHLAYSLAVLGMKTEAQQVIDGADYAWRAAYFMDSEQDYIAMNRKRVGINNEDSYLRSQRAFIEILAGDFDTARGILERDDVCRQDKGLPIICAQLAYSQRRLGDEADAMASFAEAHSGLTLAKQQGLYYISFAETYILLSEGNIDTFLLEGNIDGAMETSLLQVHRGYLPWGLHLSIYDPLRDHADWPKLAADIAAVQAKGRVRLAELEAAAAEAELQS